MRYWRRTRSAPFELGATVAAWIVVALLGFSTGAVASAVVLTISTTIRVILPLLAGHAPARSRRQAHRRAPSRRSADDR